LIVLRTFSKWAGLAGLRVGYGAFPEWLLPTLWKAKQPYNVNVAASAAAIASLQDSDALAETVARLIAERERLARELGRLSFLQPYPSWANFLLCKVLSAAQPGDKGIYSGAGLKEALSCQGIMVRYFDTPRLWDYIRISAGRPEDTEKLLVCLNRLREPDTIPAPVRSSVEGENPTAAGAGLPASSPASGRRAQIRRTTRETSIDLSLNLDGCGQAEIDTGLGFFDHMLMQIAVHGLFDLCIHASGDLHVDAHHTVEDVALALGKAFDQALGERTGIQRAASFTFPMDEALAVVAVDFSGRPYAVIEVGWKTPAIGAIPTSLFDHFFESFAAAARCNLHARLLYGRDDHHQAEALFKALARVLDAATQIDPRRADRIPSSKGLL
jgi:imidazoleglycerol-phosphate dehydratase